jgi:hypothetical protein
MRRSLVAIALFLAAGCGETDQQSAQFLNRKPCSVRGWVLDVKGAQRAENMDLEIARRQELFVNTSIWIENTEFATGGIAENGAFVILDVPPASATIGFQAPGADQAKLPMLNVPPTAEVFIPDVILEPGGATVLDPKKIQVRVPAEVDQPRLTGKFAQIGSYQVPITEAPINAFGDRREYPKPGGFRPVATFK